MPSSSSGAIALDTLNRARELRYDAVLYQHTAIRVTRTHGIANFLILLTSFLLTRAQTAVDHKIFAFSTRNGSGFNSFRSVELQLTEDMTVDVFVLILQ